MSEPVLVAGVGSSTQSCRILVCDASTGAVVREATAPYPDGTEVESRYWWQALKRGCATGCRRSLYRVSSTAWVLQDDDGTVVRPALLWNDTRSAEAAADLVGELGGPAAWAEVTGSVPLAAMRH